MRHCVNSVWVRYYCVIYGTLCGQPIRLQGQSRFQQQLLIGCRDTSVFFYPQLQVGHSLLVRDGVCQDLSRHHVQDMNQLRKTRRTTVMKTEQVNVLVWAIKFHQTLKVRGGLMLDYRLKDVTSLQTLSTSDQCCLNNIQQKDKKKTWKNKWMNYLINLELQYELQLGEAVTGRSIVVFASLLRRPL